MPRLFALPILAMAALSCQRSPPIANKPAVTPPSSSPQPMLDAPEITVTDFLRQQDLMERDSQSALVRTWKRVPGWKNYRIVRSTDFKTPEWIQNEPYAQDVERRINNAYEGGEMSGANGLAVIVIDKAISAPQRYSCIVFISRPGERYDLYWVFKNEDLSHFTMGRHSGNIYLDEYRDDGTTRVCDIRYSRKQNRWACEFN